MTEGGKNSASFIETFWKNSSEVSGLLAQRAKKVMSDSLGLVDFAMGLVNSVLNLPDGQVKSFVEFKKEKELGNQFCSSKRFWD